MKIGRVTVVIDELIILIKLRVPLESLLAPSGKTQSVGLVRSGPVCGSGPNLKDDEVVERSDGGGSFQKGGLGIDYVLPTISLRHIKSQPDAFLSGMSVVWDAMERFYGTDLHL